MTIIERATVREAFERARTLEPHADVAAAVAAVAQSLALPVEAVADALELPDTIDSEGGSAD